MEEIWKSIPNSNGKYEASSLGNIRSVGRYVKNNIHGGKRFCKPIILSQKTKSNGYKEVCLYFEAQKGKSMYVHRLVIESFLGEIPRGLQVNHIDGDKSNNRLDNLEIVTNRENSLHSYHILGNPAPVCRGQYHPNTKLTDEDVIRIRKNYKKGESNSSLYEEYSDKVSLSSFRKILYGATWKHLL